MHPLPPKKEVALALLERSSVHVHLDPRAEGVVVPAWFKKQPQLVLQIGLNMPVPIPDLRLDEAGMTCTLSFSRAPFYCVVPWSSVYAMVGDDGRGMVWPENVPPEVAQQAKEAAAKKPAAAVRKPSLAAAPSLVVPDARARGDAEATDAKGDASAKETPAKAKKAKKRARVVAEPERPTAEARGALVAVPPAPKSEPAKTDLGDDKAARAPEAAAAAALPLQRAASSPKAESHPDGRKPRGGADRGARPKRELPPYLRVVK